MRDKEYFELQLKRHIKFLIKSCKEFDQGDEEEALRISNSLRVVFKTKGKTISLIDHLNIEGPFLYDTRTHEDNGDKIYSPLVGTEIKGSTFVGTQVIKKGSHLYRPTFYNRSKLLEKSRKVDFPKWWNEIIFKLQENGSQYSLSRANVILTLAEQDGGTHVDKVIDLSYDVFNKINALGSGVIINGAEPSLDNSPIYPSVRQIAFESLESLKEVAHHLF
jgi:hypothetical protein